MRSPAILATTKKRWALKGAEALRANIAETLLVSLSPPRTADRQRRTCADDRRPSLRSYNHGIQIRPDQRRTATGNPWAQERATGLRGQVRGSAGTHQWRRHSKQISKCSSSGPESESGRVSMACCSTCSPSEQFPKGGDRIPCQSACSVNHDCAISPTCGERPHTCPMAAR